VDLSANDMIGFTGKIMVGLNAKYCKNTIIFYYAYGVWALLQKKKEDMIG
jgi:hypothetical protein